MSLTLIDERVIGDYLVRQFAFAPVGTPQNFLPACPRRVLLIVSCDSGGANGTIRNRESTDKGVGRTLVPGETVEYFWERHAPLLTLEWWAVGTAGLTSFSVTDVSKC